PHGDPVQAGQGNERQARHARRRRGPPQPLHHASRAHPSLVPRLPSPYVTRLSSSSARVSACLSAALPCSTANGGLYTISTAANGRGRQNRSQDRSHQAEEVRAPAAITSASACWAAASAPGFIRSAGPRGPSGVSATSPPCRRWRTRPSSPTSPPRLDDPRTTRYPRELRRQRGDSLRGARWPESLPHQGQAFPLAAGGGARGVEQREHGVRQRARRSRVLQELGGYLALGDQVHQAHVGHLEHPDRDGEGYGIEPVG